MEPQIVKAIEETNLSVKRPRIGDRPKRGIKDMRLTVVDKTKPYRPHHQKTLLIELLEFKQGTASVSELVELIESNADYWKRLNTVQSPYNCVVYHAKQLAEGGFLKIETMAGSQVVETQQASTPAIEVIEYANNKAKDKAKVEEQTITDKDKGDVLEVIKEVKK
jgi:hypothetical protein